MCSVCFHYAPWYLVVVNRMVDTYPNFQYHCVDNTANDGDKVKHVPRIFEEVLRARKQIK